MKPDFKYYFIDHYYYKSLDEFIEKLNRGSARTYKDLGIQYTRLNRYYAMNEINIKKLKFIENKTNINIKKYINWYKKKIKIKNHLIFSNNIP